jgi:hypothetical protein
MRMYIRFLLAIHGSDKNIRGICFYMIGNPTSIEKMYPRVPVMLLVSDEVQRRFCKYFLETGEFQTDPFQVYARTERPHKRCVSVSLFKRNADNRVPNEFPLNEAAWNSKYWNGLLNVASEMAHFPKWKLRIYVERGLGERVFAEFRIHPQVEIYQMNANSIGSSPGALWRFMALADPSLEMVLETDIDEPLMAKADYIRSFEMDSRSIIGRVAGFVSDGNYLVAPNESTVKNYATMTASCVMSRPAQIDFDMVAALRGFMAYRRYYSESERPWAYDEDEDPSAYNLPIGCHIYGWGSHWYMYGFDERFLKHVLYYHFAERGGLHTWTLSLPPSQLNPEGLCDLQYIRSRENTVVNPHTAVRFAPLQLAPNALRIAFILDEHRWVFESLLQIIQKHSSRGLRRNLFFRDTTDPYCIDLVGKQLNLFQAAQHASNALEIGFNAGHGAAIMLLANPSLTVCALDTCFLAYTKPCFDFLNSIFEKRIALIEAPQFGFNVNSKYNLMHIDSGDRGVTGDVDLVNALAKCVDGATIIIDDYDGSNNIAEIIGRTKNLVATDSYTEEQGSHYIFRHRLTKL